MTTAILLHLAVFSSGLLAGVFLGSALVEHAMRRLDALAWLSYKQAKEVTFAAVMPGFLVTTVLLTIATAATQPKPWGPAGACALLLLAFAVTAVVHLPINKLVQACPPSAPPPHWDQLRKKWRVWNWVRCVMAVSAFASMLTPFSPS